MAELIVLVFLGIGLAIYGASFELMTAKRYLPDLSWVAGHKEPICLACPQLDDSHLVLPPEKSEEFNQRAELVRVEYESCLSSPRYPSSEALKQFAINPGVHYEDDPLNLRSDDEIRQVKKKQYCQKRAGDRWDHEFKLAAGVSEFHYNPLFGYREARQRWNMTWKSQRFRAAWDIGFGVSLNIVGALWMLVSAAMLWVGLVDRIGEMCPNGRPVPH